MSWKLEVQTIHSNTEWTANGLRFATYDEAMGYGRDFASRWTLIRGIRATECKDTVSDAWGPRGLSKVENGVPVGEPHVLPEACLDDSDHRPRHWLL